MTRAGLRCSAPGCRGAPTIVELAEEYGVSRVTVWRVLRGRARRSDDGLDAAIAQRSRENEHPLSAAERRQ